MVNQVFLWPFEALEWLSLERREGGIHREDSPLRNLEFRGDEVV